MADKGSNIVICGGGIIGVCTAYYLSQRGVSCTVVDRAGIASCASGKAGGFLAKDWSDRPLSTLSSASFDLHMELSDKFPQCDYRRLDTLTIGVQEGGAQLERDSGLSNWIDGSIQGHDVIGTPETTAQVHPYKLTNTLMEAATKQAGSKFLKSEVKGVVFSEGKVTGVKVADDVTLPADAVVLAMGPWVKLAKGWCDIPEITNYRAHSIIMQTRDPVSAHALFVEYVSREVPRGKMSSPEVYPRPDGTVYMCGMSDNTPLPDDPGQVQTNHASCERLKVMAGEVSTVLDTADVTTQQACYLPVSPDGLPVIGAVPSHQGLYMASGHGVWGILNGPITGKAMAELILDGEAKCVNLGPFSPRRFN